MQIPLHILATEYLPSDSENISRGLQSQTTLGCQPKDCIPGWTNTQLQRQALAQKTKDKGKSFIISSVQSLSRVQLFVTL